MSSTFLESLQLFYRYASNNNDTSFEPCVEEIDHYKFYQYSLIPAVLMCCLFGATKTRRQIFLSKLGGRPGLVYPMDTLTRDHSFSYACAFGVTVSVVFQILDEQKFAIEYSGPISLTTLIAVVSMLIYGIVFFPVFASLALATAVSYGIGAMYVWMFFIIEIYKLTECQVNAKGRIVWIIRDIPNLFCLAYLGVTLPLRCTAAIMKKRYFSSKKEKTKNETLAEIKDSYQGIHVRKLLIKPVKKPPPPVGKINVVKNMLKTIISRFIYQRKKGFQFPSRLVSVMFVAGCVIYMASVEFLVFFANMFSLIMDGFSTTLDEISWSKQPGDTDVIVTFRETLQLGFYLTYVLKVSTIVSVTLSGLMSLVIILHMMTSFRKNLFALYRGDFKNIPPIVDGSAVSLCVGSMKFAGYQVAYLFWGYMLSCVVLFIISIILAIIIILLKAGYTDWLVGFIGQIWPGILMAVAIYLSHIGVAKFFFLQDKGQHLRLNNRRFYFVFTYFVFFFNIFIGLMSCLMRIAKAIAIGVVFLSRLDNSTLPRAFEFFDPGFDAYRGFIHMEAAHTHPVVTVFIRILMSMAVNKKENSVRIVAVPHTLKTHLRANYTQCQVMPSLHGERRAKDIARFKWHMTYTLLQNPTVRIYRKGYMQALKKAREEGIKVPISDKVVTDLDLVKSKEQRENERLEELQRIRSSQIGCQNIPVSVLIELEDGQFETVID